MEYFFLGGICFLPTVFAATKSAEVTSAQAQLFSAVSRGNLDRVREQIAAGVNVNFNIKGFTPLMVAKTPEMVKLLAESGANVNAQSKSFGQTMLMLAVGTGKLEMVEALIEAGADVNAKDKKSGMTALSWAVYTKKVKMINPLIKAGADPNKALVLDMPMLSFAAMSGNVALTKVLIENGANVNVRNKQGATPLMTAVSTRRKGVAKLLIEAGADTNAHTYSRTNKRGKKDKNGSSAMDIAKTSGDSVIAKMLKNAGAKESEKAPELDYTKPNPPAMYSLPCGISGSPPPQGRSFSCSSVDQVADSGVETVVYSRARFGGKHLIPMKNRCEVDLGQPGSYIIRTTTASTPWDLVCRSQLRTTTGKTTWIAYIRKKKSVIKTVEHKMVIKEAKKKEPKEKKTPPAIKIIKPLADTQFVFNDANPAVLKIEAEAEVTGDCDAVASWKIEDVGDSKKKFTPKEASNVVTISFNGLPKESSDFGKKKITASACGKSSKPVIVEVFFKPEDTTHPGKGSGDTPNWFYYWGETKAGKGFKPDYTPIKIASNGSHAVGQYDYTADKVFLTDQIMQMSCAPRVKALGGTQSKGIDCFAETVRHETQHKKERWEWWGSIDPTKLPGAARRAYDADGDLVPNKIEKQLEKLKNCREWDPTSCDGRPKDSLFDVEMNAYWIGWEWPVGSANKEDWSQCGKQWIDVSVCLGHQRW